MSAMKLDEKALAAFREALELPRWYSDAELLSAIRAYIEAATPPDAAKIARSLEALAEHLSDQPLTHADSTDLATIRQAATALRLSAGGAAHIEALEAENARLREALDDLLSWFPEKPSDPEWRLKAGKYGADDAVEAARRAREGGNADG